MKRGPKAKPTKLKVLEGNPGRRPLPKKEPTPSKAKSVAAPAELDAEGKKAWRRVVRQLKAMGLYTEIDRDALMLYSDSYSLWLKASRRLRKDGILTKGALGAPKLHPAVLVADKAFQRMKAMISAFGMTPADRVGLAGEEKEEVDEFTAHQQRRKKGE